MKPIYDVTLRNCHDIRHIAPCTRCGGMGDDRAMLRLDGSGYYHRICFKRRFGLTAVMRLPAKERGQFTIAELGVAGMRRLLGLTHSAEGNADAGPGK